MDKNIVKEFGYENFWELKILGQTSLGRNMNKVSPKAFLERIA